MIFSQAHLPGSEALWVSFPCRLGLVSMSFGSKDHASDQSKEGTGPGVTLREHGSEQSKVEMCPGFGRVWRGVSLVVGTHRPTPA